MVAVRLDPRDMSIKYSKSRVVDIPTSLMQEMHRYTLFERNRLCRGEESISSLKVLADETGGFAIVNTNDFKKGIQRIDNEMSDYYILGYTSSNPDPLKVTRKLEIKVKRDGAVVTYPPVYRIKR